jgi:outer membrane protein TolC
VDQTLFDAGQLKQQKQLDRLNSEQELLKNEVEMYKLIDRVSQLYCSILLMRENLKTLNIYKSDITNKKGNLAESLKNGLILQSNLDELEAEELKTEQSIIEAQDNIQAIYQSLGMFINMNINDSTELSAQPIINTAKGDEINRPELKLFNTQKALLDARYKLNTRNTLPHLALNGQGAYGRPGPNFLNQNLRFFAQGGISLKWNIGSLYNLSNEKQNVNISKQMIDVQKEVFDFNLKTLMIKQTAEITSLKAIIEKDEKIIEKRHNISLTASKQLDNGNITSTDYLTQLNAEMQAILNKKMHEIKLMNAITSYNSNKGINNF